MNKSSYIQTPSTREASNHKLQADPVVAWSLKFLWSLEVGIRGFRAAALKPKYLSTK
jgi:hypothetical protein